MRAIFRISAYVTGSAGPKSPVGFPFLSAYPAMTPASERERMKGANHAAEGTSLKGDDIVEDSEEAEALEEDPPDDELVII
jgi:hypothetical protein